MMANRRPRISAGIESRVGYVDQAERRRHLARGRPRTTRPTPGSTCSTAVQSQARNPATTSVDRQEVELERTHDAERSTAAAERPEQVGFAVGGRSDERAVGEDQLGCGDSVALQTQSPGVPADPAADASSRPRRRRARTGAARPARGLPAASARSPHSTPAPTRAIRFSGSMRSSSSRRCAAVRHRPAGPRAPERRGRCPAARPKGRRRPRRGRPRRPPRGTPDRPRPRVVVGHPEVPRRARHVVRRVAGKVHRAAAEPSKARRAETLLHRHESLPSWLSRIMVSCPT